jgi:subtilase family serine protease
LFSALGRLLRRRILPTVVSLALACSIVPSTGAVATVGGAGAASGALASFHRVRPTRLASTLSPPTDQQCRTSYGVPCYSPQEMRTAYGLNPVLHAGYDGTGQTIIIVDSFGSPTVVQDLHAFDQGYGLPDPPSLQVLAPIGAIPPFDQNNSDMVGWAFETSLDVQWAHAMAPGANIVLLESPVAETEGTQGMPEFLQLEQYALDHNLGKIISQSWGATENTLMDTSGEKIVDQFNSFYAKAALHGITVFASSGDSGVANIDVNNNFYPFPTVIFPASSPWVTAVGGTSLTASVTGQYQSEVVWNSGQPSGGATGGGLSQMFPEPRYQTQWLPSATQTQLNGARGIPDISYNADLNTPILVSIGFFSDPTQDGYYFIGGTSEGAPQWAGIIADANQWAGHPLGFLNPRLYALAANGNYPKFFRDITVGNNGQDNLPGYNAGAGWDLTTGWGSPRASALILRLIAGAGTSQ